MVLLVGDARGPPSRLVDRQRRTEQIDPLSVPPPGAACTAARRAVVVVPELLELDEDPLDDPADTLVIPVVVTADESETGAGRRRGPGVRRGGETSPWRL